MTIVPMQVLASIQIKRLALVQMNQTLDYSFEDTPVSNQAANGSQVTNGTDQTHSIACHSQKLGLLG